MLIGLSDEDGGTSSEVDWVLPDDGATDPVVEPPVDEGAGGGDPVVSPPVEEPPVEEPPVEEQPGEDSAGGEDPAVTPPAGDGTAGDDPVVAPPEDTAEDTGDTGGGAPVGGDTGGGTNDTVDEATPALSVPIGEAASVMAGRVTTFDLGDDVASVEILAKPDVANLTVNPDNSLALVLTQSPSYAGPQSFSVQVGYADGSSQTFDKTVEVEPLTQLGGWSTAEKVYMLETDEDGNLVIEHGDTHRVVHISNDPDAMTRDEVAAENGFGPDQWGPTGRAMLANPHYGATPETALAPDAGMLLWEKLTEEPGSHWLLLERGYEYDIKNLVLPDTQGESELHPVYFGAYGEGAAPVMTTSVRAFQEPSSKLVIEGIETLGGLRAFSAEQVIFSDIIADGGNVQIRGGEGLTLRNSTIHDVVQSSPKKEIWSTADRVSGFHITRAEGVLVEGLHVDQIGWEDDYDFFGDPDFGQAPNKMSQNIYIQKDNLDVTFRDSISMRASSYGAQLRPGGYVEDVVFIDNAGGMNSFGGAWVDRDAGIKEGNFTFITDTIVTSGASREVDKGGGTLTRGLDIYDQAPTLNDTIVVHLADPENPEEQAAKKLLGNALLANNALYNDTIVYNWVGYNKANDDENVAGTGIDLAQADATTIQNFTADVLGLPNATIDDLGEFLRTQFADGLPNTVTADDIIAYFQETFLLSDAPRTEAETVRFFPNDLADGVRWDNRINWTTEDLPGTVAGDSVDLAGNWVSFATVTASVEDLDFGSDGRLDVTSGRLNVEGETTVGDAGGEIDVRGAGQIWLEGYGDTEGLDVDVEGGRFANTGFFDGLLDLHVTGGQALLGIDDSGMTLGAGSRMEIEGSTAKVGFDGNAGGMSTLRLEAGSELRMTADAEGFSTIGEFRSGALGNDAPDVLSAFDMGEGIVMIDVGAIAGGDARQDVLVETDRIEGMFDGVEFIGLGADQDATLIVDYDTDTVTVSLGQAGTGSGQMNVDAVGDMVNAMDDAEIWGALTEGSGTIEENPEPPEEPEPEMDDEAMMV
jgi:hypothetical protein